MVTRLAQISGVCTKENRSLQIGGWTKILDFASRHNVAPQTEHFPMSKINEAFARLESGKARYRIVLDADF